MVLNESELGPGLKKYLIPLSAIRWCSMLIQTLFEGTFSKMTFCKMYIEISPTGAMCWNVCCCYPLVSAP